MVQGLRSTPLHLALWVCSAREGHDFCALALEQGFYFAHFSCYNVYVAKITI